MCFDVEQSVKVEQQGDLDIRSNSYMEGTGHPVPNPIEAAHHKWGRLRTIITGSDHDMFFLSLRKAQRDKNGFISLDGI